MPGRESFGATVWGAVLLAPVHRIQVLLDHPQREIVVALSGEHVAQPLHVRGRELPVSSSSALRLDQSLGLQKPDLGDRDIWEIRSQLAEH
jgi:hypothetical protein